jgi:hypothetical protein
MLHFKIGVGVVGLMPQMLLALRVVEDQMNILHCDTIVTSCNDSQHMSGSKHYSGAAFDFRTKHTGRSQAIGDAVRKELGPLGFDVLLEDLGGLNEHLHVEYDPK